VEYIQYSQDNTTPHNKWKHSVSAESINKFINKLQCPVYMTNYVVDMTSNDYHNAAEILDYTINNYFSLDVHTRHNSLIIS